jgi:hypothetical protein
MLFYPFPMFSLPPSPAPVVVTVEPLPVPTAPESPRDILLTDDGDIYIAGGDIWFVGGIDAIAQECKTALQLFTGEYLLDATAGVPWLTLLDRGTTNAQLDAAVRQCLRTVPDVATVDNVTITRDTATRRATIGATVTTDAGATLVVQAVPEATA